MPRGHLVIRVKEASGKNKAETTVWDPNFIEGFVRAELRTTEGKKTNVQTQPKRVIANQISWDEELRLDVNDVSRELRLMLCREKRTGTRVGTSVIAACGIFVKDILEAAPIDKYFELFKPGAAGEGGFIRIGIDYEDHTRKKGQANGAPSPASDRPPQEFYTQVSLDPDEATAIKGNAKESSAPPSSYADAAKRPPSQAPVHAQPTAQPTPAAPAREKSGGKPVVKIGLLLIIAGAAAFLVQQKRNEEKEGEGKGKGILARLKKK